MKIVNEIKEAIRDGHYDSGERLPSLNVQMEKHNCSKGTVLKAYDTLRTEHIIYAKPQSGYFVANDLKQYQHHDGILYDLSTGNPTVDNFSIIEAKHVLNVALESYRKSSLEQELRGVLSLNRLLVKYLQEFHIYVKRQNIFLTQGVIQMITFFSQIDFPNGKEKILIESPTFPFCCQLLKKYHADVLTINRTEAGINLEELELLFKHESIKFFYIVPRNHNPLGTILPNEQRKKIMELALKYDVYIVEDDYFNDSFSIPKYEPLFYYSSGKNCIYLKSYSKLFPYIRIGYAIVPDALLESYHEEMEFTYFTSYNMPSLVSQATLEASIRSDIIKKNGLELSDDLHQKIKLLNKHTKKWNPEIAYHIPAQSGFYSTIILNKSIDIDYLIEKLHENHLSVQSNDKAFYHESDFDNSIRITLTRIQLNDIPLITNLLYTVITEVYSQ
ncbi:aminotransferase-like domain-containing protein [Erysipelothrix urinaevulpis]|nr:PLP-dependent aminotransferase family protein [Erysipelothrix urinaevulpis]